MSYSDYALICKAMGDPTRMQIVDMLQNGSLCACKILDAFQCTQPTLSYHMKMLTDCGLVCGSKDGKWTHYSLNKIMLDELITFLSKRAVGANCNCE